MPPKLDANQKEATSGDIELVQPSIVQSLIDAAAKVEQFFNLCPSPTIGELSPTDPSIRPADHSPDEYFFFHEENSQKNSKTRFNY